MNIKFIKYEGGCLLLRTDDPDMKFLESFKPGNYDIVKIREKRSNRANSYMWALCRDISEAVGIPVDDVYKNAIREMPVYKDIGDLSEADASTLKTAWEKLGKGWVAEQVDYEPDGEHVVYRFYYGSSTYNVRQMQRLIDILLQDASAVGIPTPEEDYIRNLMEEYERQSK